MKLIYLLVSLFLLVESVYSQTEPKLIFSKDQSKLFKSLSPEQLLKIKEYLKSVEEKLPPTFFEGQKEPLKVSFYSTRSSLEKESGHYSTWHRNEINLSDKLIREILEGPNTETVFQGTNYSNSYKYSQGVLVHNLAHWWDKSTKNKGSKNPVFLRTNNWKTGFFRDKQLNISQHRSIDPRESISPEESFAVNFEHFVLDPEFASRKPSNEKFFQDILPIKKETPTANLQATNVVIASDLSKKTLDPKRIYRIDYMVAEGQGMGVSSLGHSMIRLVICAPERTHVGPECLEDTAYHLVVNPAANIPDVTVYGGLTGAYTMNHNITPLTDIIKQYTYFESRGLKAYPLKLNEDEKINILNRIKEISWSYESQYKVISNNCSHEAWSLIQGGKQDAGECSLSPTISTPKKLLKMMETETSLINLETQMIENNTEFSSYTKNFDKKYLLILQNLPKNSKWPKTLNRFYELNPQARETLFKKLLNSKEISKELKTDLLHLTLQFESFRLEYLRKKHLKDIFQNLAKNKNLEKSKLNLKCESDRILVKEFLNLDQELSSHPFSQDSYGIPMGNELMPIDERERKVDRLQELASHIYKKTIFNKNSVVGQTESNYQYLLENLSILENQGVASFTNP